MKFWKYLPAELAHGLAPWGLALYSSLWGNPTPVWRDFTWRGIYFPNRLGVAGGVDKNATQFLDWQDAGAGFVEIGTVTPHPQKANSGKILDRDWAQKILWNKMGFPNQGAEKIFENINQFSAELEIPLFINIGKNRDTDNQKAIEDYKFLAQKFSSQARCLVINVSSPNTKGLRDLQNKNELENIVSAVIRQAQTTPVLVKLSPDLSKDDLASALEACMQAGTSGFILTNTTLSRPTQHRFSTEGGLSGSFLAEKSKLALRQTMEILGTSRQDLLIISAGGVLTPEEVLERLHLGANLVQVYSALVFNGPGFFKQTAQYYKEKFPKGVST